MVDQEDERRALEVKNRKTRPKKRSMPLRLPNSSLVQVGGRTRMLTKMCRNEHLFGSKVSKWLFSMKENQQKKLFQMFLGFTAFLVSPPLMSL
jgi:hypothetical protein